MRKYIGLKNEVTSLRSEGKTYSEIIKIIGVVIPKSTLSDWCKNVIMPVWYQKKIDSLNEENLSRGLKTAHASNLFKRQKLFEKIRAQSIEKIITANLDHDTCLYMLSMLHFAEGGKWKSHKGLMFGNSDPDIIQLYVNLLKICYDISPATLKCRVGYRADQNLNELEAYWSVITGIPDSSFYKSIPDPRTVGKPTRRKDYKGVCVIYSGHSAIQLELEMLPGLILRRIEMGL